ncbi:hypothetical protein GN956_G10991 [Arapaima gigas]
MSCPGRSRALSHGDIEGFALDGAKFTQCDCPFTALFCFFPRRVDTHGIQYDQGSLERWRHFQPRSAARSRSRTSRTQQSRVQRTARAAAARL